LASLSLTHVHYDPNDPLSLLCAYLSLVPQGLIIVYVTLVWAHRELEIVLMLGGQLFCEGINWILKRLIKETRPSRHATGKGYGMPSSHAQFIYFFASYLSLWMLYRVRYLPRVQRHLISGTVQILAFLVALSRVYLHYHTPRQVIVGVFAGSIIGIFWFLATEVLKNAADGVLWDLLLDNPISRSLLLKDMCSEIMLQQMEWNVWCDERSRRKSSIQFRRSNESKIRKEAKRE